VRRSPPLRAGAVLSVPACGMIGERLTCAGLTGIRASIESLVRRRTARVARSIDWKKLNDFV
jgi:hypothetical protein